MSKVFKNDFLSPEQLGTKLGFHPESIRRMIREGRIPCICIGGRSRVHMQDVYHLIKESKKSIVETINEHEMRPAKQAHRFEIIKGIPHPSHTPAKFPFSDMEEGDSFFVHKGEISIVRVRQAVNNYHQAHKDFRFSVRQSINPDGCRVWRV